MQPESTTDDVTEVLDHISELTDWEIDDWSYQIGRTTSGDIRIGLQYDPPEPEAGEQSPTATLLEIIRELESGHDEGAPIKKAVLLAMDRGMEETVAWDSVEELRQKGEVYEPRTDHLRVA